MKFRTLRANEINVRIQSCSLTKNKEQAIAIYLLYKDARCDMNILDESVGAMNWKRTHEVIDSKLYCNVSIYDENKRLWVTKQDVGTESNTEAEKGQASDSFKRACFNWGIGRELYTSPFIKIKLNIDEYYLKNDRPIPTIEINVAEIQYDENKNIVKLILTDNKGAVRFEYDKVKEDLSKTIPENPKPQGLTKEQLEKQYDEIRNTLLANGINISDEKVASWIKKNAKVDEVDVNLLSKEQIKAVNTAMIYLLQQKKAGAK